MIFEREGQQEFENPTPRKLASELKKLKYLLSRGRPDKGELFI